ncbi:MAG: alpha-ketoacid dehydrogenase subunit beta, partial [Chloroflexi bacterium]|nr:alpha-ketoacid dehydrogenase subunit beta [Chloroflexota bacterium]
MVEKTNVQAVHDTLLEEFRRDDRVMILGEDVGKRGGVFRVTDGFIEEFGPHRVLDMPLAEASIVGVAIGLALAGFRPIAEMQFADFSTPAFDQIVQEAARIRYRSNGQWGVPMVVRMPWGAGVRGALYHSQSVEVFYAHVPGLKVVAPSTPADITGMLRSAIRDPDPVIFLEHKATYRAVRGDVPDGDQTIPLGTADLKREGTDITVFAYGLMLHHCLRAAETLAGEGISAAVVDVRSLRPLDAATIVREARRTGKCLVVYEDNRMFGAGAEIA